MRKGVEFGILSVAIVAFSTAMPVVGQQVVMQGDVSADFSGDGVLAVGGSASGLIKIQNGADLRVRRAVVGGQTAGANSVAYLLGPGTRLGVAENLWVGTPFATGKLSIENGAVLTTNRSFVGYTSPAALRIVGRGSMLKTEPGDDIVESNEGLFFVNFAESYDGVTTVSVSDGGFLQTHRAIVGGGAAVTVAGQESAWLVGQVGPFSIFGGELLIGGDAGGVLGTNRPSTLTVRNGGSVVTGNLGIHGDVLVRGTASQLVTQKDLFIDHGNVTVEQGGQVVVEGRDQTAPLLLYGSAPRLIVRDPGSLVRVGGDAVVGGWSNAGVTVANGGKLLLGSESGEGTLTLGRARFPGLLVVGAAEGNSPEAAGTLDARRVVLEGSLDSIVLNHTTPNYEFLPDLVGGGAIRVIAGATHLAGDAAEFTGLTSITGGELVLRNILGGDVEIGAAGRLSGNGSVLGNATVSGMLSPAAHGMIEFSGGLTIEQGGRLEIAADAAGRVGVVEVGGLVTLEEGAVLSLPSSGFHNLFGQHVILRSERVIDGRFSEISSDLLFLTPTLSHDDPTAVALSFERNELPMARPAVSRNQKSVASAIEKLGPANPAYNALIQSTAETLRHNLEQLSGDAHATVLTAKQQHTSKFRKELVKRTRAAGKTKGERAAPSSLLHYAPPVSSKSSMEFPVEDLTAAPPATEAWLRGYSAAGSISGDENAAGSESMSWGIIGGVEVPVSNNGIVGVAVGYQSDQTRIADRSATAKVSSFTGGIYGSRRRGELEFRGGGSFTWNNISSRRSISVPGLSGEATAGYDGWSAQAYGEAGYLGALGETELEPFVGLTYNHTRTGAISETGLAGATLSAAGTTDTTLVGTLGLRVARNFTLEQGWLMRPQATVTWDHDFLADKAELDLSFAGSSDPFRVTGPSTSPDSLGISLGMEIENARFGVAFSYEGRLSSGASEHAGLVKARVGF
ncbi:MAG TPA: autotransporter outer membrane beta-barrel domain-containing protein [Devosiaceae bacterium]|jgi:outer membrane autotransporter protein|nr:autotransporter outer membrane beta-barrel domain-containing protein [Devosiaceae bacterium]